MGIAKEIDYDLLAQELVRSIRADKSQEWVNQRLNSSSNVVHRWEKGHAKASWHDFISLCNIFRIDLAQIFISYFRYDLELSNTEKLLSHFFSSKKLSDISNSCGIAVTKLRRLKKNDTALTLNDFLQITFGLDDMDSLALVYEMNKGASIPHLDSHNEKRVAIAKNYFANPNIGLILICLDLPGYKKLSFHQDSFLATVSGLEINEVHEILEMALNNGLIEQNDKGLYVAGSMRISDRGTPEQMKLSRKFWLKRALEKLDDRTNRDAFGSVVFTTTQGARDEIISLYLRFFEDFKSIVAKASQEEEQIPLVLNFNMFATGDDGQDK